MAIRSADTSIYDQYHGASFLNTVRTGSHIAGIRYGLNDLNLDKNKSSSNFRHKDFESSNRHKQDRASQTATHDYNFQYDPKILIPLDLNERKDTTGYSIQSKPEKTIYKTQREFLFAIVTSGGETLWKSKNSQYPNKVIYKIVDGQNKLKVYFPEPMPRPKIASLKVVRPVRGQHKPVDRSGPGFKHRDPSKVAIEITDPHRPEYKFYRYADPGEIPADALPKYRDARMVKETTEPVGVLEDIDPSLKVHLISGDKIAQPRPVPIALPMSINIDEPPEDVPEAEPEPVPEPESQPEPVESAYVEDEPDMRHCGLIDYITLNIQEKETTYKFCFFEDIRTKTAFYFAKKGFLFNKVQMTRQYHARAHDWYYQWKAKQVFAKMVMVIGIDDVLPFVAIFLTNNHIVFYTVSYVNCIHLRAKRYEADVELNTEDHPQNVAIYTMSSSGEQTNDVSKYEVSKYDVPNSTNPFAPIIWFYHFTFKPATYLRIKINRRLLWERTTPMRPQSLYYFKDLDLAVLEFDYHLYNVYKYQSDMWFLFHLD
ncbi:hypothetical protein MACK_003642 [Theileria orientalis]|uniref:Uncharacterized protein n=1 Tax=Theileria orientalis TaxID=68886 RepID=A0A976SJF9_THEOR|nr:hypothetical protein MACK_003642 [Theileria orientalis]